MREKISAFDVADYLDNEETIAEYLSAVLEQGDPDLLVSAIGDVAKARGMSQIASTSGLGRESLYKALAPGAKPRFETILKVLGALGVQLRLAALPKKRPPQKSDLDACH
ncbi:MAG: putative addiction module antidote protein [Myxococcota bacterium]|nr:putative addiction module antidote protein [Myxococcota bacterium]